MTLPGWMPVTIYAIIVLVFLGMHAWNNLVEGSGRRQFVLLVFLVAFQLLNDFVSRLYEFGNVPPWIITACTYINFLVLPAIGIAWFHFVRSMLTAHERNSTGMLDYVVVAIAAMGVAVILTNPLTGWVFFYNDLGTYFRGPLYIVPAGSAFLCILLAEAFLLTRAQSLGRRSLVTMLFFPVPPIIGAVAAVITYGLPWMPLGMSISMVVLFASIMTTGMNTDYLTGVSNRRRIEELLEDRIDLAQTGRHFAAIMVDVDNFKTINDTLGHAVGDEVLADTAHLLEECLRSRDFVGRFGGDEFFVLLDVRNEEELEGVVARINAAEKRYNDGTRRYDLRLSKGYALFDANRFGSAQAFETHLDERMYADKESHRHGAPDSEIPDSHETP